MGDRPGPGSARRHDGGAPGDAGLDAIAQYGRGDYDEATGLYEWYDLPSDHSAKRRQGGEVAWRSLIEQWALLEADWSSEYGERLARVWPSLTWREFRTGVAGLLACDSRLSRYFGGEEGGR